MMVVRWFGRAVLAAVAVGAVVVMSGSALGNPSPVGDAAAAATCQGATKQASSYGLVTGVLRAESSNAGAVAVWQESRRHGTSSFRAMPSNTSVTVCIFSGEFSTPAGPLDSDGNAPPAPNALRVLVYGGQLVFDSAGNISGMSPETPSDMTSQ